MIELITTDRRVITVRIESIEDRNNTKGSEFFGFIVEYENIRPIVGYYEYAANSGWISDC